jgi:hypothetical protein
MMNIDCYPRCITIHLCRAEFVVLHQSSAPTELVSVEPVGKAGYRNFAEHQDWIEIELERYVYSWQRSEVWEVHW